MTIDWLEILKISLVVFTITRFEPLIWVLETLPDNLLFNSLKLLLTCSKCLSLYLGAIYFWNIFIGMALSFFFTIFEKSVGRWLNKIDLRL